jgi:hypothetical protein
MKVVDFFCIGPQRTASSWLDRSLRMHPDLILPTHVKETFFFDRHYQRGFGWYSNLFDNSRQNCMLGEVGPTYFESQDALNRIILHNGKSRIIILARNPIARTFSLFCHERAKGRVPKNFFEAIRIQNRIVESGRYSSIAPRWESAFGYKNVLYVAQEDICSDPGAQLIAIFDFLGVDRIALPVGFEERFGQGVVPRYTLLAGIASRAASALRSTGFHRLVQLGKRMGLNRVYRGGDVSILTPTMEVFGFLLDQHNVDIEFLENRLGRTFPLWRSPSLNTNHD